MQDSIQMQIIKWAGCLTAALLGFLAVVLASNHFAA
jgi:hypothetical protein